MVNVPPDVIGDSGSTATPVADLHEHVEWCDGSRKLLDAARNMANAISALTSGLGDYADRLEAEKQARAKAKVRADAGPKSMRPADVQDNQLDKCAGRSEEDFAELYRVGGKGVVDDRDRAVLRALTKYALSTSEDPKARLDALEDIAASGVAWFEKTHDGQGRFNASIMPPQMVDMMRDMVVAAQERLVHSRIDRRAENQHVIEHADHACTAAFGADPPEEARAALVSIAALEGDGHKNGASTLEALQAVERDLLAYLDKVGANEQAQAVLDAIQEERESVERVRAAVGTLAAPQDATAQERWERTGEWNTTGGLRIVNAEHKKDGGAAGKRGTAEAQARAFVGLVDREVADSNVFAEVITMFAGADPPVPFYFGKNSCPFADSFQDLTVDQADFESLPDDPVTATEMGGKAVGFEGQEDKKIGCCKGEMVLHVIEERLYEHAWQQGACHGKVSYNRGHYKCLSEESYQHRYRAEKGAEGRTVEYSSCGHGHHLDLNIYASDGVVGIVEKVDTGKASNVGSEYQPDFATQTRYEQRDPAENAEARIAQYLGMCMRLVEAKPKEAFDWESSNNDVGGLEHWIIEKCKADPDAVTREKQRIFEEIEAHREEAQRFAEVADQKRAAADAKLGARPATMADERLHDMRAARAATGLNDATAEYQHVNCALVTLGAIGGNSANDTAKAYLKDVVGLGDAEATALSVVQDQTLFWRAENGIVDPAAKFNATPGMPGDEKSAEVGDAMLRGLRKQMASIAVERNREADEYNAVAEREHARISKSAPELGVQKQSHVTVVQDGVNEDGQMYSMDDLLVRMARYPDGTQFQVFVHGQMQHWVYGEKYNGSVVLEDYQMATAGKAAGGYDGSGPHNPLTNAPDAFERGMFLAIAPETGCPADQKTTADWPQIGSAEADVIDGLLVELRAATDPGAVVAFCRENATSLCADAGWADALEQAVAKATNAIAGPLDDFWDGHRAATTLLGKIASAQVSRAASGRLERMLLAQLDSTAIAAVEERQAAYEAALRERAETLPPDMMELLAALEGDAQLAAYFAVDVAGIREAYVEAERLLGKEAWEEADVAAAKKARTPLTTLFSKSKQPVQKRLVNALAPLGHKITKAEEDNRDVTAEALVIVAEGLAEPTKINAMFRAGYGFNDAKWKGFWGEVKAAVERLDDDGAASVVAELDRLESSSLAGEAATKTKGQESIKEYLDELRAKLA